MTMRVFLILTMMVPLTACTAVTPDPFLTASVNPVAPSVASEISPDFAIAALPVTAGRIKAVRQTLGAGTVEQVVVYDTPADVPGENTLSIDVGTVAKGGSFARAPTRGQVLAEMRAALPGIAMTIEPQIGENAGGVYGYATGRHGANTCLYAWQLVSGKTDGGFSLGGAHAAKIRLRLCQPGTTEQAIGSLMQGLVVKPVTKETLAFLRFAGGTGRTALAPPAPDRERPAMPPAAHRRARAGQSDAVEAETVVLPISRHDQPSPAAVVPETEGSMQQAAAVPLPSEISVQ